MECNEIRSDCAAQFEAIEAWQARQNHSLDAIQSLMNKVMIGLLTTFATLICSLVLLVLNLMGGRL
jgi:hypothetical protein